MTCFTWLHLTDFHYGMTDKRRLWSNTTEGQFFEDIEKLHRKSGPWDLVLFTGDLTFSGDGNEFSGVDQLLMRLLDSIERLNLRLESPAPKLLAVPGNHDLRRFRRESLNEQEINALDKLLKWHQQPEGDGIPFWRDESDINVTCRALIEKAFSNYQTWFSRWMERCPGVKTGILPGDFSYTFKRDNDEAKLGILGLNTAFLQLEGRAREDGGDYYECNLAIHQDQFDHACSSSGDEWARNHHACILITHHPWNWLHPDSRKVLGTEVLINRFVTHLCGHMHIPELQIAREIVAGHDHQYLYQGRSLFGLDKIGEQQQLQRCHGYMVGRIKLTGGRGANLTCWPRSHICYESGAITFVPDHQYFFLENGISTNPQHRHLNIDCNIPTSERPQARDELIEDCQRITNEILARHSSILEVEIEVKEMKTVLETISIVPVLLEPVTKLVENGSNYIEIYNYVKKVNPFDSLDSDLEKLKNFTFINEIESDFLERISDIEDIAGELVRTISKWRENNPESVINSLKKFLEKIQGFSNAVHSLRDKQDKVDEFYKGRGFSFWQEFSCFWSVLPDIVH